MSFKNYVAKRRVTDTPAGDFVSDAKRDGQMPDARTWPELDAYLRSRGAHQEAINAARSVWRAYLAAQKREETADAERPPRREAARRRDRRDGEGYADRDRRGDRGASVSKYGPGRRSTLTASSSSLT